MLRSKDGELSGKTVDSGLLFLLYFGIDLSRRQLVGQTSRTRSGSDANIAATDAAHTPDTPTGRWRLCEGRLGKGCRRRKHPLFRMATGGTRISCIGQGG